MEAPERLDTAENVANYFRTLKRTASAHFCIDADSVVQCVPENRVAFHAPGVNTFSIGLEHAGYARQTQGQWLDDYSRKTLFISLFVAADLCRRHGIQPIFRTAADLRAGRTNGITTHAEVSKAFRKSDHWDPGPNFPIHFYIYLLAGLLNPQGAPAPAAPPPPPAVTPPPPPPSNAAVEFLKAIRFRIEMTRIAAHRYGFRKGARSEGVEVIQQGLAHYGAWIAVDGVFGEQTKKIVQWFQSTRGLKADGVVGGRTFDVMYPPEP